MIDLTEELSQWRFLEDCLLHDLRFIEFGLGVELTFNYVWATDGSIRSDALDRLVPVRLRLVGVESLRLIGGLANGLKADPAQVDWGLSEIARVVPFARTNGLGLSVEWEGTRRIDIEFVAYTFIPPDKDGADGKHSPR